MEGELSSVQRVLEEFFRDPERPLNYFQLAKLTNINRGVITGVIQTLVTLGLVKPFYHTTTNKQFLLDLPFDYRQVVNRIRSLLPQPESPELQALIEFINTQVPLDETKPIFPVLDITIKLKYTKEECLDILERLIPFVLTADQIRGYYEALEEDQYTTIDRYHVYMFNSNQLGLQLPESARYKLVEAFKIIFEYTFNQISSEALKTLFNRFLEG